MGAWQGERAVLVIQTSLLKSLKMGQRIHQVGSLAVSAHAGKIGQAS